MALQVDDDWKKQAQEEKRRLAEQARAREESAAAAKPAAASSAAPESRRRRSLPEPSFLALVQTMLTQAHYALGEYAAADGEPMVDLDTARFQLGLLDVLEARTRNNLSVDEQQALDGALYELRSRYVQVATSMIR